MLTLQDDQYAVLSAKPVNRRKVEAAIDGGVSWRVLDERIVTLSVAADGLSAKVTPAGTLGETTIEVSADAELGAGMQKILATVPVKVVAGGAFTVTMTVLRVQEQENPDIID